MSVTVHCHYLVHCAEIPLDYGKKKPKKNPKAIMLLQINNKKTYPSGPTEGKSADF